MASHSIAHCRFIGSFGASEPTAHGTHAVSGDTVAAGLFWARGSNESRDLTPAPELSVHRRSRSVINIGRV